MKGTTLALSLAATLTSASPVLFDQSIHKDVVPIVSAENAAAIEDHYMVVMKEHVKHTHLSAHTKWVEDLHLNVQQRKSELKKRSQTPMVDDIFSGLKHTYNIAGSFLGYSGHFDEDVIEQIRRHPDVSLAWRSADSSPRHRCTHVLIRSLGQVHRA